MRASKLLLIGIAVLSTSSGGCQNNTQQVLSQALQETDCITYKPPRGDRGPGSIFQRRDVQGRKRKVDYPVCENLYSTDRSVKTGLSFEQHEKTSTYDASFTASLLAGLIKSVDKASANLSSNGIKTLRINWGPTESRSLPDEVKFDKKGKLIPLSNQCAAALHQLKDANRLDDLYMVQVAVRVESLFVTKNTEANQSADVDVSLRGILGLHPGVKFTEKDSRSLEIKEPRYICAYPPIHITEFIPKNALGPESAIVIGEPITREQWREFNSP